MGVNCFLVGIKHLQFLFFIQHTHHHEDKRHAIILLYQDIMDTVATPVVDAMIEPEATQPEPSSSPAEGSTDAVEEAPVVDAMIEPEATQPEPSVDAIIEPQPSSSAEDTTQILALMRAQDPQAFASVYDMVGWLLSVQMAWSWFGYNNATGTPMHYPDFQSPLLATEFDPADFRHIVAETMADRMPEDFIDHGVEIFGFDPLTMVIDFQIDKMHFCAVIDSVYPGDIEMHHQKVAMTMADIAIPTSLDKNVFDEELDGHVMYYRVCVRCRSHEDPKTTQTQGKSKRQKK